TCGCIVKMQAPPSTRIPSSSSSQIDRTSAVVEIFFVHSAGPNHQCAASSRSHCTGSSTMERPSWRYGHMSSMKFEEYAKPCASSRSSVLGLKSHEGDR